MLTGYTIFPLLSIPLILLIAVSIAVILYNRKPLRNEGMLLLLFVNGILLIKHLLINFSDSYQESAPDFDTIFNSIEFVTLLLLFRLTYDSHKIRQAFSYFLLIYLSVLTTLFFTGQLNELSNEKKLLESFVLLATALWVLIRQINEKSIFIFHAPLFWIAGGTICYYSMSLGTYLLGYTGLFGENNIDWQILLLVFNTIRHLFYLIACFKHDKPEQELRLFKESSQEFLR